MIKLEKKTIKDENNNKKYEESIIYDDEKNIVISKHILVNL